MSDQLMEIQENTFVVANMEVSDLQEIIGENLGGEILSPSDLDRVKVPAGGSTSWTLPTLEGEEDVREFEGVIIHWSQPRVWWESEFTGENTPPDCSSEDGKIGIGNPGGRCDTCPLSQWGSDPKGGKGQACKQLRMLFILRKEGILPLVLSAPPTSIQPIRKYFLRLASAGESYMNVVTKFSLERTKNDGGIQYSRMVPSLARKLTDDEKTKIRAYATSIKPALESVQIQPEDYAS